MIFVDSNVPMYLIGADHPHKRETTILLEKLVAEKTRLVTNTEVLQEILHRYSAIRRKEAIQPAFDCLYGIVDEIFTITEEDLEEAKDLILLKEISARDTLHASLMKRLKIKTTFSFDAGFDTLSFLKRIPHE